MGNDCFSLVMNKQVMMAVTYQLGAQEKKNPKYSGIPLRENFGNFWAL